MGLFDTLLGRTKPVRANLDALFALPSAAITLQTAAGLVSSTNAGVCWKPPAGQSPEEVQREINELLVIDDPAVAHPPGVGVGVSSDPVADGTPPDAGSESALLVPASPAAVGGLTQAEDAYGYRWLLLDDPDLESLVTRAHLVNSTLSDAGWGPQLLCSVFGFVPGPGAGPDAKNCYLVYLYKRGTFYPFAPDGREHRNTEFEFRIRSVLGSDLPVETDLARWFPLWELPVR